MHAADSRLAGCRLAAFWRRAPCPASRRENAVLLDSHLPLNVDFLYEDTHLLSVRIAIVEIIQSGVDQVNTHPELERLVREHVSVSEIRDLLHVLFDGYRSAWIRVRQYEQAQRQKLYGWERLVAIEQGLKDFAQRHPSYRLTDAPIETGSYKYVALQSGPLVLTVSKVRTPTHRPKTAKYREALANGQHGPLDLFPDPAPVIGPNGRQFYHVLLLHGLIPHVKLRDGDWVKVVNRREPSFALLVVPDRTGADIWHASLFAEYPDIIAELRIPKAERARSAKVQIRMHAGSQEAEGDVA